MAENLTVQSPDLARIKKEAGDATMDGVNTIWQALNAIDASARRGIRLATDMFSPRVQVEPSTSSLNNYDPSGCAIVQFTGGSAINLTGLKAPETNKTNLVILFVTGAGTVTVKNSSASSIAENQIVTNTGADVALATGKAMILVYLSSKYRQVV